MNAADFNRWIEMDRLLCERRWGLNIPSFAKKWGISERQIKRDLAEFRKLGQETEVWQPFPPEVLDYCHRYKEGVEPLFTWNLQKQSKKK